MSGLTPQQRFGPFDEFLGAERELRSQPDTEARGFKRLWAHPDYMYDTVGSTLRLICSRLSNDTSVCARGVSRSAVGARGGMVESDETLRMCGKVGGWGAGT